MYFYDKQKQKEISEIYSPFVWREFEKFCKINKNEEIVFFESALISSIDKRFDKKVYICADLEDVFKRLRKRNTFTDEEITSRIKTQEDIFVNAELYDLSINTSHFSQQLIANVADTIVKSCLVTK